MRGSSFILKSRAPAPCSAWSAATRASASTTIVRNLKHANSVPSRPTRVWRKTMGPRSCAQMRKAAKARIGANATMRAPEPTTSKMRLPQRLACLARGGSRCTRGSPPTGRIRTRSLETSVTLGATTTWTLCSSRSHTAWRMWAEVAKAPAPTKTVSALRVSTTQATSSVLPQTRMPEAVSSR